jgi:hypothetical protein
METIENGCPSGAVMNINPSDTSHLAYGMKFHSGAICKFYVGDVAVSRMDAYVDCTLAASMSLWLSARMRQSSHKVTL